MSLNSKSFKKEVSRQEWEKFHKLHFKCTTNWGIHPYQLAVKYICKKDTSNSFKVADFGCGKANLAIEMAKYNPSVKVTGFDHYKSTNLPQDIQVLEHDVSDLPDELKETYDWGVFVLSLMGTNSEDYLKQAFKVLKQGGKIVMYISEIQGKGKISFWVDVLKISGFEETVVKIMPMFYRFKSKKIIL